MSQKQKKGKDFTYQAICRVCLGTFLQASSPGHSVAQSLALIILHGLCILGHVVWASFWPTCLGYVTEMHWQRRSGRPCTRTRQDALKTWFPQESLPFIHMHKFTLKFLSFFPVIIVIRSWSAEEPIKDRLNRGTVRHVSHKIWSPVKGGGRRKNDDRSMTAESTSWHESMKEKQFMSPKHRWRACNVNSNIYFN